MNKLFALASILIIVLASCRPEGGMNADAGYFSITKLKNDIALGVPQINKFKKSLTVDGKTETIIVDSLKFDEVVFIADFEINKPAYKNSYKVEKSTNGLAETTVYTLKEGFKFPVKRIEYSKANNGSIKVVADLIVKNLMTTNFKHFEGTYSPDGNMGYTYTITEELVGLSPSKSIYTLQRIL
jgi:hypothetical protein